MSVPIRSLLHINHRVPSRRMCAVSPATGARQHLGNALQNLYEVAKADLEARSSPTADAAQRICEALEDVSLEELGLERAEQGKASPGGFAGLFMWRPRPSPPSGSAMTYLHIHEEPAFSLGIFCLPQNACIPLHDHPDMTVFSRVLYGSLHVRSFDWFEAGEPTSLLRSRKAMRHPDRVVEDNSGPAVLHPAQGGNIHAFTAQTDCAILDLLTPPYDSKAGRACTYYKEVGSMQADDEAATTRLQACDPGVSFSIVGRPYKGQKIVPH